MKATLNTIEFVIRETRSFYGPKTVKSLVMGENHRALTFKTAAEAESYIVELNETIYYTASSESGRPEHKAISTAKLPAYLANQL
jgi:hypothetical protein